MREIKRIITEVFFMNDELVKKIEELKELFEKIKIAENAMYDENLQYVEGTFEIYNVLENSFNELATEIAKDFISYSEALLK